MVFTCERLVAIVTRQNIPDLCATRLPSALGASVAIIQDVTAVDGGS